MYECSKKVFNSKFWKLLTLIKFELAIFRNQKVRESVRPSFLKFPSICKIVEETEETSRSQFHILSFETNSLNKNNTIRETPLLSPPYAIRIWRSKEGYNNGFRGVTIIPLPEKSSRYIRDRRRARILVKRSMDGSSSRVAHRESAFVRGLKYSQVLYRM